MHLNPAQISGGHSTGSDQSTEVKPARVSIFVGSLRLGGVAGVATSLAQELQKRGFLVEIVVPSAEGEMRSRVPEGVQIVDLGTSRLFKSVFALARYLKQTHPTAVISLTDLANAVSVIARAISRVKCRLAISCHMALCDLPPEARRFIHSLLPLLMRFTYRHADAVIAVSDTVADQISKLSGMDRSRILVIDNPVDIDRIRLLSEQKVDHPWISGNSPVILSVGRLVAQKEFSTLIKAFAMLRQSTEAKLLILGEGYTRSQLELTIKSLGLEKDVSLPGYIENPYRYMRRASVFVLPSSTESFGLVLIEALICGCRIVATNASTGPRNILGGGKYGRLVPPGDAEALAGAIEESLHSEVDKDALFDWARRISEPAKCVDLYLAALNLQSPQPPSSRRCTS